MGHAELIELSLEIAAERAGDLVPLVYPRFFTLYPEAVLEFGDDQDDHSKGKMLVNLLMEIIGQAENKVYPNNIRRWISDHFAYGVVPSMYTDLFTCLLGVVKESNGSDWSDDMAAAWQAQFDGLMVYVDEAYV